MGIGKGSESEVNVAGILASALFQSSLDDLDKSLKLSWLSFPQVKHIYYTNLRLTLNINIDVTKAN